MPLREPSLSPRQLSVKRARDRIRRGQLAVEGNPGGADHEPLGDDARIVAGGEAPAGLLDHPLIFRGEPENAGEGAPAERRVGSEAYGIDDNRAGDGEGVEHRGRDGAVPRVRVYLLP